MYCDIQKNLMKRSVEIVLQSSADQNTFFTMDMTMHEGVPEHKKVPCTSIPSNICESFFKAFAAMLQREGYIPRDATHAQLEATQDHLKDMRQLVFKGLDDG